MVTHSLAQAASLGDRLILVHRGRIALDVAGPAKRRLTRRRPRRPVRCRCGRADQLDDAAARTLARASMSDSAIINDHRRCFAMRPPLAAHVLLLAGASALLLATDQAVVATDACLPSPCSSR